MSTFSSFQHIPLIAFDCLMAPAVPLHKCTTLFCWCPAFPAIFMCHDAFLCDWGLQWSWQMYHPQHLGHFQIERGPVKIWALFDRIYRRQMWLATWLAAVITILLWDLLRFIHSRVICRKKQESDSFIETEGLIRCFVQMHSTSYYIN